MCVCVFFAKYLSSMEPSCISCPLQYVPYIPLHSFLICLFLRTLTISFTLSSALIYLHFLLSLLCLLHHFTCAFPSSFSSSIRIHPEPFILLPGSYPPLFHGTEATFVTHILALRFGYILAQPRTILLKWAEWRPNSMAQKWMKKTVTQNKSNGEKTSVVHTALYAADYSQMGMIEGHSAHTAQNLLAILTR